MDCDYSWNSLLRPGEAGDFFCCAERVGPFRPELTEYSLSNAWWLSEICRLIYRRGEDETGIWASPLSRNDFLRSIGLKECFFVKKQGLFYSLVSDGKESFAILVFRGTSRFEHWFSNLNTLQTLWPSGGMIHTGFKNEFDRIQHELSEILSEVHIPLFYTGHSLGGAFATLTASIIPPRAVYTFGSPRVGNAAFRDSLASVNLYRIATENDIVTTVPPSRPPFYFCHAGEAKKTSFRNRDEIFYDNNILNLSEPLTFSFVKRFARAPHFLAAHSPVNYSRCLLYEADFIHKAGQSTKNISCALLPQIPAYLP